MASEDATHFTRVDQTADPGFFIHFLDEANKLPGALAWKPTILDGLRLQPGSRVLDLGCGAGDDAFDLAGRVSPGGDVIGVDVSATLINEATRRAVGRDLAVTFEVGDAQSLRFSDGTFYAVRTERMLMHVPDPKQAFSEMARVLRPGGRIAVADLDWGTQFCDSPLQRHRTKNCFVFLRWDQERLDWPVSISPVEGNRDDRCLGFFQHPYSYLRFPPTAPWRAHRPCRLRGRPLGARGEPLVDASRPGE